MEPNQQSSLSKSSHNHHNSHHNHKKSNIKNNKLYQQIQQILEIIAKNKQSQKSFDKFSFFIRYLSEFIEPVIVLKNSSSQKKKGISLISVISQMKYNQEMDQQPSQKQRQMQKAKNNIIAQKLKQIFTLQKDSAITKHNIVQLVAYLKIKSIENKKNSQDYIFQLMDEIITQLVMDNQYIKKVYLFKEDAYQQKIQKKRSKQNSNLKQKLKSQIMKQSLIKDNLGIECPMCCVQIQHSNISLLSCGHFYHKTCFQKYAELKILQKSFPILCPTQECKEPVSTKDMEQEIQGEILQKFYDFTFQTYVQKNVGNTSWCPSPGCTSVFAFDQMLAEYRCPACKKTFCLKCKCEMHNGMTCEQYRSMNNLQQDDKAFIQFAKGAKYKQCPKCKFWVEKNKGCHHMVCRCKFQFCYKCGKEYGTCVCQQSDYQDGSEPDDYDDNDDMNSDIDYEDMEDSSNLIKINYEQEKSFQDVDEQMEQQYFKQQMQRIKNLQENEIKMYIQKDFKHKQDFKKE